MSGARDDGASALTLPLTLVQAVTLPRHVWDDLSSGDLVLTSVEACRVADLWLWLHGASAAQADADALRAEVRQDGPLQVALSLPASDS